MINLLARFFIKDYQNTKNREVRKAYGILMSIIGIILNVLLSAAKFFVGSLSGAISITADALNNLSDAGSQVISLISFKLSSKPADREHPFGHARLEYVASMIVAFIILLVGLKLGKDSVYKIFNPEEAEFSLIVLVVLALSIAAKLWLCLAGKRIAKRIDSTVISAAASDSFSDVLSTSAVLISALISKFTSLNTDAYMGIIVSVLILIAGIRILNETKNFILGSGPDPEIVDGILAIAKEEPEVLGVHDLVVHNYGVGTIIATFDAEVDGSKDVYHIHNIIDGIEKRLCSELEVKATIHVDPVDVGDENTVKLEALALEVVKSIDAEMSIHDFRVKTTDGVHKLIFDVEAPYEVKCTDDDVIEEIQTRLKESDKELTCEVTIDRK